MDASVDRHVDGPAVDAPAVDGPALDAPGVDAPGVDAPGVDAPGVDGRVDASADASVDLSPDAPLTDTTDAPPDEAPDGPRDSLAAGDARQVGALDAADVLAPAVSEPRALALPGARHFVVDATRRLLYVTVAGSNPTYPNTLVVVDPSGPTVVKAIPVGKGPNVLDISDDASTLWLGIDEQFAIQQVDLSSGTPVAGAQHKLPGGVNYPHDTRAGAMKVLRGTPSTVIVSLLGGGFVNFVGVRVLDNGVPRGPGWVANVVASSFALGRNADVFAVNGTSTGFEFFYLRPTATGLTSSTHNKVITDFASNIVFADDRVYATTGDVVDVRDPATPTRDGTFPFWGQVLPVPGSSKVLMLSGGPRDGHAILRLNDTSNLAPRVTASVGGVREQELWDLARVGPITIAFLASDGMADLAARLVVVETSFLP